MSTAEYRRQFGCAEETPMNTEKLCDVHRLVKPRRLVLRVTLDVGCAENSDRGHPLEYRLACVLSLNQGLKA